jgi:YidC/Oxa1 family membrane protein insertase
LFTLGIRAILFPLNYLQLSSSQKSIALNPKLAEIREKYPDNKELQGQMTALLYQETEVNPLAGCLPALVQIPVFIALYRSFLNLASKGVIDEPFLWFPNLEGPTFGARSTDWITAGWQGQVPSLGWHDTIAYLTIPLLLFIAQSVSLRVLTPPSDDPAVQKSQQILKYLPLMISYFSLSVPAGLGVYWIINNVMSTVVTGGIKAYLKSLPGEGFDIDLDALANSVKSAYVNPAWGYGSEQQMVDEAKANYRPARQSKIPVDFV